MKKITLPKFLAEQKLTISLSEGRRLVVCGAVFINDVKFEGTISDEVELNPGDRVRVGRHKEVIVE